MTEQKKRTIEDIVHDWWPLAIVLGMGMLIAGVSFIFEALK